MNRVYTNKKRYITQSDISFENKKIISILEIKKSLKELINLARKREDKLVEFLYPETGLSPSEQTGLVHWMCDNHPEINWIILTNSPYIVRDFGDYPGYVFHKKKERIEKYALYTITQISDCIFYHDGRRSIKVEKAKEERNSILRMPDDILNLPENQKRLKELEKSLGYLGFIPFGESRTQIQAQSAIEELVEYLKNKKKNENSEKEISQTS